MARPYILAALPSPVRNRLLSALSPAVFEHIRPHLQAVELGSHHRLMKPGFPTEYLYFPETCMVSLILTMGDGSTMEVGLIGNEGLVGVLASLGASTVSGEAIVQMPGTALRISTDFLRQEIGINASIRQVLLRYVQALFAQVSQSAACNGRHVLAQRLARWLLMAHDCAEANDLALSHEFLSMMIGVRRSGVTEALGALKDAGIIDTRRGWVTILDRKRLEAAACECYATVRREYERLLGSHES